MYVSQCTKSYYGRHWCRWKLLRCRYKERIRVMRRILHCQSRAISSGLSNTLYLYRVHTMIAAPQETNLDTTVGTANMIGVVLSTITYGTLLLDGWRIALTSTRLIQVLISHYFAPFSVAVSTIHRTLGGQNVYLRRSGLQWRMPSACSSSPRPVSASKHG